MQFTKDDRDVSEVVGAILVFGQVVLMLVILPTFAVPSANAKMEVEHSQHVQDDIADLQQIATLTAVEGDGATTRIEAGVRYPVRFFLLNPGPASGSLTTEPSPFGIDNGVR